MKTIYGPIPSRRLGKSLGVDPTPLKTCNWNCVYCQLGRTSPLVNERAEYAPAAEIIAELQAALASHQPGEIDFISFVGSGEPTLHSQLGWMIRQAKRITTIPIAVITNGSLLYLPEVRTDLLPTDVIMPTLTAGSAALYQRINRPHPELTFDRLIGGLEALRAEYAGNLWLEVMLIKGLNDDDVALHELAALVQRIRPDQLHLTLPDRPPSEPWVEPPDQAGLMRALAILGNVASVVHPAGADFDLSGHASPVDALLAIIIRHPISEQQMITTLQHQAPHEVQTVLSALETSGQVQIVEQCGVRFWAATEQHFAGAPASK